jgi:hypothetical protein
MLAWNEERSTRMYLPVQLHSNTSSALACVGISERRKLKLTLHLTHRSRGEAESRRLGSDER